MPRPGARVTPAMLEMPLSTVTMSVGARVRRQRHDLRGQAVAELEAVRHQEVHRGEAPASQRPHHERGAGRAVRIEVADHQHAPGAAMLQQQLDRCRDALECAHREQPLEGGVQLRRRAHPARCVNAPEHRMQPLGNEEPGCRASAAHDAQFQAKLPRPARRRRQSRK